MSFLPPSFDFFQTICEIFKTNSIPEKNLKFSVMFYTISLLLWAATWFSPTEISQNFNPNSPQNFSNIQLSSASDSLIFNELNEKLAKRRSETCPEKIYLQLDRTLFEPGETVWFAAYIRNADNLFPSEKSQILYVELLDSRGSILQKKEILAIAGTAAGEFDFAAGLPGGLYKIKAYTNWSRNFEENFEREITLQKIVLPRLNLKLEFEKKAHGAGDEVTARFDAQTLENQPFAAQKIKFSAAIEGTEIATGEVKTDKNGRAFVKFKLPENLDSPDGLLNISLENEGQTEAISRAIPIVLNKIDLQFFPEGGDAVAGLPCKMAFKATDEFGKPADIEVQILDAAGREIATFSSFHNGMGAFHFLPKNEKYTARLTRPISNGKPAQTFDLPEILGSGMAFSMKNISPEKLKIQVAASQNQKAFLVGTSQDKIFYFKELDLSPQLQNLEIPTQNLPIGIARFTLFDGQKNEQAERLVFVNRDKKLVIEIRPNKEKYLPRENVKLKIQVRDAAGNPVAGQFSMAVGDENQLTFTDNKQGYLLSNLLLEQDLHGKIEEPNFYFDTSETKSLAALDFLMMTHGWRRFAWREIIENQPFVAKFQAEKTILSGQVFGKKGQPKQGTWVTLLPDGPSLKTDKNGFFQFENFDILQFQYLEYGQNLKMQLGNYATGLRLFDTNPGKGFAEFYAENSSDGRTYFSGTVVDEDASEPPFIGANVFLKNKENQRGTTTDVNGFFKIEVPPGNYDLTVSYIGFQSLEMQQIQILPKTVQIVSAKLAIGTVLNEVVVTGFASQKRKNVSSAVKSAPKPAAKLAKRDKKATENELQPMAVNDEIAEENPGNVEFLQGRLAGVQAVDGDNVKIKGARAEAKEFAVDGIRVQNAPPPAAELAEIVVVQDKIVDDFPLAAKQRIRFDDPADDFAKREARKDVLAKRIPPKPASQRRQFVRAREFFVPKYENRAAADRNDFRPTIFWKPNLETDKNGRAEVEFSTSDAITNFRVTVEGIGAAGQPAHSEGKFFVQKPISISAKTPAFVISGDVLKLQIAISNKTNYPAAGQLSLAVPTHFSLKNQLPETVSVAAGETKIVEAEFEIGTKTDDNQSVAIRFRAAEAFEDAVETKIKTVDRGFPVRQVAAGNQDQNLFNFNLNEPIEGTVSAKLTAYPNALDDVLKGMERMLGQPGGCFEQISSTNYPNLLVIDLLRSTGQSRPEIEERARQFLQSGYSQLKAYESKSGGFDWWGRDPAHEGLTAYGVLQFKDMENVFSVDKDLIFRTLKWLAGRRDGNGGWNLNPNYLHTWNNETVAAYLAWAISEAGEAEKFQKEITAAAENSMKSGDPYQISLLANAFLKTGDPRGQSFLKKLLEMQADDGTFMGKNRSITGSTGQGLKIETTALAALAMLQGKTEGKPLQNAMDFIISSKTEYGYGSTQSTVLALKALVNFAKKQTAGAADGTLVVQVNGKKAAELDFSKSDAKPLEINDLGKFFTQEKNQVEVFFKKSKTAVPFDIELKYASRQPKTAPNCPLQFSTEILKNTVSVGETVRLKAILKNKSAESAASPMVIVGIPAGLTLQPWQLKQLVEQKKCDFYELWDGFAVFHFEGLAAGDSRELNLDLRADIAGKFEAPASQAFLYYENEQRVWAKPGAVEIR